MPRINLEDVKQLLAHICDVEYRTLDCRFSQVHLIYIPSMTDTKQVSEFVIRPLLAELGRLSTLKTITNSILQTGNARVLETTEDIPPAVLKGGVVVIFPHLGKAVYCRLKGYPVRAIEIPQTETVIKGPREGFTEDLATNLSEVRRRLKTPSLKVERFFLGTETQTETALLYIENCTPQKLVDYVREKIQAIQNEQTEYVFYSNQLEDRLRCKHTPFDTIGYTEKPDVAVCKLAEGRVLVLVDGTPFVITAPLFFIESFQTTDDYTLNPIMANMGRIFRWIAFFMSTFIPSLYLALVTYHFKLVPNIFLYRLALFRAGVPVPTFVELLYMIFFFQIIREAGVRLPQPIGPTLSIVGALILGESAVASGLSSQVTVVIVAITSIASYLTPVFHAATFTWSIFTIILAAILGLPGFYMGFVIFVAHLAGLTSCGYPYLYPFGTGKTFKHNDVFFMGNLQGNDPKPLSER